MSTTWKDALADKPSVIDFVQSIVDQVPTTGGAQDAFEMALNGLATFVPEEIQIKADKFDALVDEGVDEWAGYESAMAEFEDEDGDDDSDSDDGDEDDED